MSEIIGRQLEFGVGVEETRGTTSPSPVWIRNISANVLEKAEHAQDESVRGVFEDGDGRRVVKKHIEGDVEMNCFANVFGYFAYNLYGGVTSTLVAGSVYDHVFEMEQSSIAPSLSLFAKDGDVQQLAFKNAHVNTLELSATTDDYVKVNVGFIGKEAANDTSAPSYDTDYDFIGRDITIKVADTEGGLAGAAALCVSEVTLNWDKGLLLKHCLGAYVPNDIYRSKMSIEGSINKTMIDEAYKDLFLGDIAKYVQITIEGETPIASAHKPTIKITLHKVMFNGWDRSGGKDELVTEDIEFKAYYNASDNKGSKLEVRNTTDEYEPVVSV